MSHARSSSHDSTIGPRQTQRPCPILAAPPHENNLNYAHQPSDSSHWPPRELFHTTIPCPPLTYHPVCGVST
eukprot:5291119-Amphidinium_carterae.1